MKRRVAFGTLGCRLNQYETDSVVTDFQNAGYDVVPFNEPADAYIINTCTVTSRSDRKSRNLIYRARRTGDDPLIVVTGCYVENHPDLQKSLEGVSYALENDRKGSIFPIVDARLNGEIPDIDDLPADRFGFGAGLRGLHTRGTVKIQDGCDHSCSYCIIPSVRGRAVSRDAQAIVREIATMAEGGIRELVLTGVNIGSYRDEHGGIGELLESILEHRDRSGYTYRLRISSIEPYRFTDSFFAALSHPAVCPHLHLCLQSGSDRILREMRRGYRLADYANIVEQIRDVKDDFNLTTDIIVGFPGETELEFQKSLDSVERFGFSHVHVFPFSAREGTPAAKMDGLCDGRTLKSRVGRLAEKAERQKKHYRQGLVGKRQNVLVESILSNGMRRGLGEHYIPVQIEGIDMQINTFHDVVITGITDGQDLDLNGRVEG